MPPRKPWRRPALFRTQEEYQKELKKNQMRREKRETEPRTRRVHGKKTKEKKKFKDSTVRLDMLLLLFHISLPLTLIHHHLHYPFPLNPAHNSHNQRTNRLLFYSSLIEDSHFSEGSADVHTTLENKNTGGLHCPQKGKSTSEHSKLVFSDYR